MFERPYFDDGRSCILSLGLSELDQIKDETIVFYRHFGYLEIFLGQQIIAETCPVVVNIFCLAALYKGSEA